MEIRVKNTTVNYEIRGEGHPMVLLHGMWLDHECMIGAFEPIFKDHPDWQRIYVDIPGMGRSPCLEWGNTSDDILEVIEAFIDKIIPNQPFSVVGFSYGGYLARGLVHRRQAQVSGMMLFAPTVSPDSATRDVPPLLVLVEDEEAMAQIPAPFDDVVRANVVIRNRYVLDRIANEIAPGFSRADAEFVTTLRQTENFSLSFDVDNLPQPYDKPVLILTGRHDSSTGFAEAGKLVKGYPRSTYAVLDRAGHSLHIEQVELFNYLTAEWLRRVEESITTLIPQTTAS